jgi:hypothetical protein
MLIQQLKLRKHTKSIGEIYWPGIGSIGVNGADRVLGSVLRDASERLLDHLKRNTKDAMMDMWAVEIMASYMFPSEGPKWIWYVHDNIMDLLNREHN